jgi:mannosyltransferase
MLWGLSAPSYWRDEADTVSAVSRTLPQLIRLLGHVDAVHGTYYLLLWPIARLFGTDEFVTRLPSAMAMAAAAAGVAAIAGRLRSRRAGLCAGLVFAALPAVSIQGHDARPYAMVTAAAVLASYLLVRVADDPRAGRLTRYGLSLVLLGYMHMFALLLVPAHAIALAGLTRNPVRPEEGRCGSGGGGHRTGRQVLLRWLVTVGLAGIMVAPLVAIAWGQRGQIDWISKPGLHAADYLITSLAGGSAASAFLLGFLAVLGVATGDAPAPAGRSILGAPSGQAGRRLTWLAAPWLVLPPVTLLAVSQIRPIYYFLYVVFCLPAVALLAGSGLAALSSPVRAAALALVVALVVPTQLAIRVPGSGGALRHASEVVAANERAGDAVIYPDSGIPPWYLAYPHGFGALRNIQMQQSGAAAGRLYGTQVPPPVLARRECGVRRIWAVEMGPRWHDPASYLVPGFRPVHEWEVNDENMRLWLYQASPAAACQAGPLPRDTSR